MSDDVYRFLWDGLVQSKGLNPYTYAPIDIPYSDIKESVSEFSKINHKEIPTVYGPFLELLFYIGYKISPSIYGVKLVFVFFELLSLLVLILLLKQKNVAHTYFVVYGLNPLVFLEIYSSIHPESVLSFFIVLLIYFHARGNINLSLLVLSFLSLTKYIAVLFLPLYLIGKPFKKLYKGFTLYFIVILGFYLIYLDDNMLFALKNYSRYWEFNGFLFKGLSYIFGAYARLVMGLMFMLCYVAIYVYSIRTRADFTYSILLILFFVFILSPVLYPWYLIMAIPLFSLYLSRAFILLTGLSVLSYAVLIDYYAGARLVWSESMSALLLEYILFYSVLFYDLIKKRTLLSRTF